MRSVRKNLTSAPVCSRAPDDEVNPSALSRNRVCSDARRCTRTDANAAHRQHRGRSARSFARSAAVYATVATSGAASGDTEGMALAPAGP
jgi:hypothetical protein